MPWLVIRTDYNNTVEDLANLDIPDFRDLRGGFRGRQRFIYHRLLDIIRSLAGNCEGFRGKTVILELDNFESNS